MKSIWLLNKNYYRCHRHKSIKQILLFCICTSLLIIQSLSMYNLVLRIEEEKTAANGTYDAVLIDTNDMDSSNVLPITDKGKITLFATSRKEGVSFNNVLHIGSVDDKASTLANLRYIEGRAPQQANEIALEKNAFSVLRKIYKLGDKIELTLDSLDGETHITKNFIVCGILENYSKMQWDIQDSDSLFPQAIVSDVINRKLQFVPNQIEVIKFSKEVTEDELASIIVSENLCEDFFLNAENITDVQTEEFISVGSVSVILFSGILAVFLLVNNVMITKQEQCKSIGLYRIVGMKKGEIFLTLLSRELFYLLIGCTLGSSFGVLILKYIYPKVMGTPMTFKFYILLLAIACVTILDLLLKVYVIYAFFKKSIFEDVTEIGNAEEVHDIKLKVKNPTLLWAIKSYLLNKSSSISLTLLLVITIIITIIGGSANHFVNLHLETTTPEDLSILTYNGAGIGPLEIPEDINYGIEETDCSFLLASPNIKKSISTKILPINIEVPSSSNTSGHEVEFWHSDEYINTLKKYGYDINIGLHQTFLYGCDDNTLKSLEKQKNIQGEIDYDALNSGKEVLLCTTGKPNYKYNIGDTIRFTQIINNKKIEFDVKVGAIITFNGNTESMEAAALGDSILWGNQSFDVHGIPVNTNAIYLQMHDTMDYEDLDMRLNALSENYTEDYESNNHFSIKENFQQVQQLRKIKEILNTNYYFVLTIIILFICSSAFLSIKIDFEQKKKAIATMRAIGLTKKNLFFVSFVEKICQLLLAIIIGTVFSCVSLSLFSKEMGLGFADIQFPLLSYIILIAILIVILALTSFVAVRSFFSQSIADQLSEE